MKLSHILALAPLAVLAACSSASPPTVDRFAYADFQDDAALARTLPETTAANLPFGTARYEGQFGGKARIDGVAGYELLGDMTMNVDFDRADVSGNLRNVNLLRGTVPDQRMTGTLAIDGKASALGATAGEIAANATGELAMVDENGLRQTTDMLLGLRGDARGSTGDVIVGEVTGGGRGMFDVDMTSGAFVGVR